MKSLLISIFSIYFLISESSSDNELPQVDKNIQCGARNCFNPEKWNFYHQWDIPPITDYVGYDIGCSIGTIKSITSSMKGTSYDADWHFQYDKQNHLLLQQSQSPSGRIYKIIIQYNSNGKPVSVNDDGKISKIEYPSAGETRMTNDQFTVIKKINTNQITSNRIEKSGKLNNRIIKTFDQQKRLVAQTDSFVYNHQNTNLTYSYNDKGLVSKIVTDYGKEINYSFREYNDYGWIVLDSTVINSKNTIVVHFTYEVTNDTQGVTIKQNRLYSDNSGAPLICRFDKWGNWIEWKEYSTILPLRTETRKITYW